ncbi:hypothetical protein [Alteromonas sp. a30]|uniref:hypothetical protein n=1 Tax=Alteromonas sp. a30 TaxID=2730917 RepID=UPI00227E0155|nr:hypothetical protein [Alteromonas sp. a30]MCY7294460.1 hypothetical protein [Alteromonas sp. a30]
MSSIKQDALVFGAGVVFEKFVQSGDLKPYEICALLDNHKTGDFLGYQVEKPSKALIQAQEYDLIILTLWDKPEVIEAVSEQLIALGASADKIKVYSYDRHTLCDLSEHKAMLQAIQDDDILYAYYDLNRSSETYDVTSFLAIADCYREQQGLTHLHMVIVARDTQWQAQAYCLEESERLWRAENIVKQACALIPACKGMTYCTSRTQAQMYLDNQVHHFPADYRLDNPPPISVHKDFYFWLDQGIDPRRFHSTPKASHYVQQWVENQLPQGQPRFISVTLRESTLQPKRNSDIEEWNQFFVWLSEQHPELSVVVIRDTENAFLSEPFTAPNVFYFPVASFHMDLRMALYEAAYVNTGCSNGPKQLCHLSKTASYITTKMIVEDYQGSSSERFIERNIEIGKDFRFADENQLIDWNPDTQACLIESFIRFESIRPLS